MTSTVPTNLGKSQCELIDKAGKAFGKEVDAAAAIEGNITELSCYMYPRLGRNGANAKVSFITRVGDLGCGVGYCI